MINTEYDNKSQKYRYFLQSFIDEPMKMSYDKLPIQYSQWKRMARQLLADVENDSDDQWIESRDGMEA